MILHLRTCTAAVLILLAAPAGAETLRCNGNSAAEGDSKISLLYKCGEPLLKDSYCAPAYYGPTLQPVPPSIAGVVVPCQLTEEWLYERGPGNLVATVRLRAGVVQSITYGKTPR